MKKILVTGGHGFIGGHVVKKLLGRGFSVIAFDRHSKKIDQSGVESFVSDLRDRNAVDQAVFAADGVIHLGGILGTAETLQHIPETVDVNIVGTLNVFEAVKKYQKPCVYITLPDVWQNPYAITKRTAKDFAFLYNREFKTKINVVRGFNVYGEGQKYKPVRKFAPQWIINAIQGKPIEVFGDGSQLMDVVYAGDTAEILVRALEMATRGQVADEVIDAGPGEGTPVIEIAQIISKMLNVEIKHLPMRAGETSKAIIKANTSTLKKWMPDFEFTPVGIGMKSTVEWYKEHWRELV
jgi:nucleoside-diphosphate-sugar epimerase